VGIRVVVVDDNPHVTWEGRTYPVNATFHRFLSGVLDVGGAGGADGADGAGGAAGAGGVDGAPVASIVHVVPLREAASPPATLALDPRIEVVGTAPFDGIEGYLRNLPAMLRANRPTLRRAIDGADLLWLKVPASNAALAAAIAVRAGVPRFTWVAGSAADVAGARFAGVAALGAGVVGLGYDLVGRTAAAGGDRVVVGRELGGPGIVTSLVEPDEIRDMDAAPWPAIPWRLRIAWAGRLAPGKGLEDLLDALGLLAAAEKQGDRVELVLLGDGPARGALEARAATLGIGERIHWVGYVADRPTYLDALATCDLFVFPSPAEGFPKVILDAMAVGLPVVARPSGSLAELGPERLALIAAGSPTGGPGATAAAAIAQAVGRLAAEHERAQDLRRAGHGFAADHTRPAEAARLVRRWQARWPELPWSAPTA
jgi:glycosyltransferase involved in cell wall biosynthesis